MDIERSSGKVACVDVEESLAELALGILPGDDRAIVLAHLISCNRCQAEAEKLTLATDTLLQLAPEVEPPVGFEARLFKQLGIPEPSSEVNVARFRIGLKLSQLSNRGLVFVAPAAVALGVALGFGGGWVANPGNSLPVKSHSPTASRLSSGASGSTEGTGPGPPGCLFPLETYGPPGSPPTTEWWLGRPRSPLSSQTGLAGFFSQCQVPTKKRWKRLTR